MFRIKESVQELCEKMIEQKSLSVLSLVIFFLVFCVHWICGSQMKSTFMMSDEIGPMASAVYLFGEDWNLVMSDSGYYGYGSALLYIPIMLLTKNGFLRYQMIICFNSILLSLISVISLYIFYKFFGFKKIPAFIISIVAGLFPGYLLYSKLIHAESVICFLPWLIILVLLHWQNQKISRKQIAICGFILSFLCAFAYASHERGIVIIITTVSIFTWSINAYENKLLRVISFAIPLLVFLIINHYCKKYFISHVWQVSDEGQLINTIGHHINDLKTIFKLNTITQIVNVFRGQIYAAVVASTCTLPFALSVSISKIVKFIKSKIHLSNIYSCENSVYFFCLIYMLLVFALSVLFMGIGTNPVRGDIYLYTRYLTTSSGLVTPFLMCYIFKQKMSAKQLVLSAVIFFVISILSVGVIGIVNNKTIYSATNSIDIIPYFNISNDSLPQFSNGFNHINTINLLVSVFIIFLGITILMSYHSRYLLTLLIIVVDILVYMQAKDTIIAYSTNIYNNTVGYVDTIADINKLSLYFPNICSCRAMHQNLQIDLPDYQIQPICNKNPQEHISINSANVYDCPSNSLVISDIDLKLEQLEGFYRLKTSENTNNKNYNIWVRGENELLYILENSNLISPSKINNYLQLNEPLILSIEDIEATHSVTYPKVETFSIPLDIMSSNSKISNENDLEYITSIHNNSTFFYGPYGTLLPGQYEFLFSIEAIEKINNEEDVGTIALMSQGNVYAQRTFTLEDLDSAPISLTVDIPHELSQMELVATLFDPEHTKLRLHQILMKVIDKKIFTGEKYSILKNNSDQSKANVYQSGKNNMFSFDTLLLSANHYVFNFAIDMLDCPTDVDNIGAIEIKSTNGEILARTELNTNEIRNDKVNLNLTLEDDQYIQIVVNLYDNVKTEIEIKEISFYAN